MPQQRLNGAAIVKLLRDGKATDWDSLVRATAGWEYEDPLEGAETAPTPYDYVLREHLDGLKRAGLVEFDGSAIGTPSWSEPAVTGPIRLANNWYNIQSALNIGLTRLATQGPNSMDVEPYFGRPVKPARMADLFVLMPFLPALKPIYEDHITPVATSLGLTVARADDFFTAHSVMSDVWSSICAARAVIADCTGRNPNVFYELGAAHTVGKPVVLITQNDDDIPFDIRYIRYIQFDYTPPGMKLFEQRLKETLKNVLNLP